MTNEYLGSTAAKLMPRPDAVSEPWTALGYLAAKNRFARLRLGTAVTDAGRRNPAVTAQVAATLHLLTKGRAILGIGTGERVTNEPYGVEWSKPVGRLIEALATIRALWDSNGELVSRDSEFFPLHKAIFELPPYRGKWPELWVASHGPRMLKATGRYADAWFPATIIDPKDYTAALDVVRAAASDAGHLRHQADHVWMAMPSPSLEHDLGTDLKLTARDVRMRQPKFGTSPARRRASGIFAAVPKRPLAGRHQASRSALITIDSLLSLATWPLFGGAAGVSLTARSRSLRG